MLSKVLRFEWEELTADERKLRNEERREYLPLTKHSVYRMKEDEMGEACGTYGGEMKCVQSFGGETEENRSLGRRKRRWESNCQVDF